MIQNNEFTYFEDFQVFITYKKEINQEVTKSERQKSSVSFR